MELVSASNAAKRLGVHPSQITRGIQSGLIQDHAPPGLGRPLVDIEQAREARKQGIDRSKQRGPAPAPETDDPRDPTYQVSRARRESAAAAKAEIELAQLRGKTLDRAEVADAAFRLGQMLREAMETRRVALATRLAGLDAPAIISVLADADEAHLTALADAIARDLAPEEVKGAA
jgi:transposase-like protein